jgi:hypothetical protein
VQLLLVHGTHHLHEHHQLSTAVFKAIKYDTVRTSGQSMQSRAYIDSQILLEELDHAADDIIVGMLQVHTHGHMGSRFNGCSRSLTRHICACLLACGGG